MDREAFNKAYEDVDLPGTRPVQEWNWEYLEAHYDLVKVRKPKVILELGVEYGFSTVAILLAAEEFNSEMWSVDVKLRDEALKAVQNLASVHMCRWHPLEMNDLDFEKQCNFLFDYIYIDTEHAYEHCSKEIEAFYPHLAENGIMAFHDVSAGQGTEVFRAIKEFLAQHPECKFTGYRQDIGIIYTQKKVLVDMDSCSCGSRVYKLGNFKDDQISYLCVKCGNVIWLPFGYRATMEVRE